MPDPKHISDLDEATDLQDTDVFPLDRTVSAGVFKSFKMKWSTIWTAITTYVTNGLAGKANTSHTQDITTIIGLVDALAGKSPSIHNHDDLYYRQTALDVLLALKANLISPAFQGTPTAPTPAAGNNSTNLATTAFVTAAINALIAGAPGALDTLKEISDALANDESTVAALTTVVAGKVPSTRTVAGKALSADITLAPTDLTGVTSIGNTLVTAANAAAVKTALALTPGTDIQAFSAELSKVGVKGADIASAITTNIGAATGQHVEISGTTNIVSFGTTTAGVYRILRFQGVLNINGGANIVTPLGSLITTAVGDTMGVISLGSGVWRIVWYQRYGRTEPDKYSNGLASTNAASTTDIVNTTSNVVTITGNTSIATFSSGNAGMVRFVRFASNPTVFNSGNIILPGGSNIIAANGDTAIFACESSTTWRCIAWSRVDGRSIIDPTWYRSELDVVYKSATSIATNGGMLDLGASTGDWISISGSANITGFNNTSGAAGKTRRVLFTGNPALVQSSSFDLIGGTNMSVQAGDTATFISTGANSWMCFNYQRKDGTAYTGGSGSGTNGMSDWAFYNPYTGNDSTGTLGNPAKPFASLTAAALACPSLSAVKIYVQDASGGETLSLNAYGGSVLITLDAPIRGLNLNTITVANVSTLFVNSPSRNRLGVYTINGYGADGDTLSPNSGATGNSGPYIRVSDIATSNVCSYGGAGGTGVTGSPGENGDYVANPNGGDGGGGGTGGSAGMVLLVDCILRSGTIGSIGGSGGYGGAGGPAGSYGDGMGGGYGGSPGNTGAGGNGGNGGYVRLCNCLNDPEQDSPATTVDCNYGPGGSGMGTGSAGNWGYIFLDNSEIASASNYTAANAKRSLVGSTFYSSLTAF